MTTVYILGAGSSRFTGFPLATELWNFLKREVDQAGLQTRELGRQWLGAVDKVITHFRAYQPSVEPPDLELILTLVDLAEMQGGILGSLDLTSVDIERARYAFARLVSSAFQWHAYLIRSQIFEETNRGLTLDRDYVRDVIWGWAEQVSPGDTIVTFNWDPLHEMILWRSHKWHYRDGYGLKVDRTPEVQSSVLILKLHGSCNWALRHPNDPKPCVEYVPDLFTEAGNNCETNLPLGASADHGESLVLPSYLKDPTQKPALLPVWEKAACTLQSAESVIALGYSLPTADIPTRTMMTLALKRNSRLDALKVVLGCDRGAAAYARWADFCAAVGKRVQPVYKTFEDFVLG